MISDSIRLAWQEIVENLVSEKGAVRRLAEALEGELPATRSFYEQLGGQVASFLPAPPSNGAAPDLRVQLDALRRTWRQEAQLGADLLAEIELQAMVAARVSNLESNLWIAIALTRVGFVDPEAVTPVYDAFCRGWLRGKGTQGSAILDTPEGERRHGLELLGRPGKLPASLPSIFWNMVGSQVDPGTITPTIAQFGATYDDRLKDACARAVLLFPGQDEIARQAWPPRVEIDSLKGCAPGSLGHAYYHLIVDNGFDPEVLDPDTVTGFHPGLDGTNRRILQQHELWHLVAGYSTSPLHETAISSFQLAQFGHNYSAIFLATVATLLAVNLPPFLDPILQVIAEAWVHGRSTQPMMGIDWYSIWDRSIEEIRRTYRIEPFRSVVPDLFVPGAAA